MDASVRLPGDSRVYRYVRELNAASLARNWRVDGEGLERLEAFQRGVLALNHRHLVDGTVVMPLTPHRILFLCDARAYDAPVLGHVIRALGAIRTDVLRPDSSAAFAAMQHARAGHLVGVFPEGKVSGADGLLPARPGVGWLVAKLDLPVLPVAMWGVEHFDRPLDVYLRRTRPTIHVRVGEPHVASTARRDRESTRAIADAVMVLIARLLPPDLRGVYGEGSERGRRGRGALAAGLLRPEGGALPAVGALG